MQALASGLVGAATLTALHEGLRRSAEHAPRMDVLGRRAIAKMVAATGQTPPRGDGLQALALGGDVIANSLYYSLVGVLPRRAAVATGTVLGLAAGIGAVTLPGPLGLGTKPATRSVTTAALTIALYTVGGLAAGLARRGVATR